MSDYLTLRQAIAHLAVPVDVATLRRAAQHGALRAEKHADLWLTKSAWVAAYERKVANGKPREGYPRGKPRRPASEEQP